MLSSGNSTGKRSIPSDIRWLSNWWTHAVPRMSAKSGTGRSRKPISGRALRSAVAAVSLSRNSALVISSAWAATWKTVKRSFSAFPTAKSFAWMTALSFSTDVSPLMSPRHLPKDPPRCLADCRCLWTEEHAYACPGDHRQRSCWMMPSSLVMRCVACSNSWLHSRNYRFMSRSFYGKQFRKFGLPFTRKGKHPVYLCQQNLLHLHIAYLVGCAFSLLLAVEVVHAKCCCSYVHPLTRTWYSFVPQSAQNSIPDKTGFRPSA